MAPAKNDKILQMIQMVHEETVRHGQKLDKVLDDLVPIKTQIAALPCAERKKDIEEFGLRLKEDEAKIEQGEHFRIKLTAVKSMIYGGAIFVFVYVLPAVAKLL